jgi:hypothetical protein
LIPAAHTHPAASYTTDGWTPTTNSPRYTGPITISPTTTLRAIDIAPNFQRSFVATGKYVLNNSNPTSPTPAQPQTTEAPTPFPPGENPSSRKARRFSSPSPLTLTHTPHPSAIKYP